jgi:hypothetical protein
MQNNTQCYTLLYQNNETYKGHLMCSGKRSKFCTGYTNFIYVFSFNFLKVDSSACFICKDAESFHNIRPSFVAYTVLKLC